MEIEKEAMCRNLFYAAHEAFNMNKIELLVNKIINDTLDHVAKSIRRHQDIVGWQPGESRNAFIQEIEDLVISFKKPLE